MESNKLPDFRSFCESQFYHTHRASYVSDGRSNPEIPASTVYHSVFLMGALGLGSLLGCDQILRTPIWSRWFKQQKPTVSDSTMARSLESMTIGKLRTILYDSYR